MEKQQYLDVTFGIFSQALSEAGANAGIDRLDEINSATLIQAVL